MVEVRDMHGFTAGKPEIVTVCFCAIAESADLFAFDDLFPFWTMASKWYKGIRAWNRRIGGRVSPR
jgi:hypothetical protein